MKTTNFLILALILFIFQFQFADAKKYERYERYKSKSESYESKDSSERKRFDNNLDRYKSYSPNEKKKAAERWSSFKEKTTPKEREFIYNKLRENKSDKKKPRRFSD